jgi:hypothetical protein
MRKEDRSINTTGGTRGRRGIGLVERRVQDRGIDLIEICAVLRMRLGLDAVVGGREKGSRTPSVVFDAGRQRSRSEGGAQRGAWGKDRKS